jgi:hypothetical protein
VNRSKCTVIVDAHSADSAVAPSVVVVAVAPSVVAVVAAAAAVVVVGMFCHIVQVA